MARLKKQKKRRKKGSKVGSKLLSITHLIDVGFILALPELPALWGEHFSRFDVDKDELIYPVSATTAPGADEVLSFDSSILRP